MELVRGNCLVFSHSTYPVVHPEFRRATVGRELKTGGRGRQGAYSVSHNEMCIGTEHEVRAMAWLTGSGGSELCAECGFQSQLSGWQDCLKYLCFGLRACSLRPGIIPTLTRPDFTLRWMDEPEAWLVWKATHWSQISVKKDVSISNSNPANIHFIASLNNGDYFLSFSFFNWLKATFTNGLPGLFTNTMMALSLMTIFS